MVNKTFTMIELLIVIAIICILAVLLFPIIQSVRAKGEAARVKSDLVKIDGMIRQYKSVYGVWPPSESDYENSNSLLTYISGEEISDINISGSMIIDSWGMPLVYVAPVKKADGSWQYPVGPVSPMSGYKTEFQLWSMGEDKVFDTSDDITITPCGE